MRAETGFRTESMRIAGEHVSAADHIDVCYPYSGKPVGSVPAGGPEHARRALQAAADYQPKLSRYERQKILFRTAELIERDREDIAEWLTLELGISLKDSNFEIGRACDVFSCDLTPHGKQRRIFTLREPLRVISAITAFNHPLNMVSHKVAPAIATNNCLVCKQTSRTPLSAMKLADLLYEAGLPPEMFSVVTGRAREIGPEMVTNPNVDLITFTGGVAVGKHIAVTAGYKRTVLELGGNDPLIVCNDLSDDDLGRAADLAVAGATKNSGQRCTAVKRILCQERVADRFVPLVLDRAKKIVFGDPLDPDTDLGTVVDADAAALFEKRVNDAAEEGAVILYQNRSGAARSCHRLWSTELPTAASW